MSFTAADTEALQRSLGELTGREPATEDEVVSVRVAEGARSLPALVRALDDRCIPVTSANVSTPTLDDVFLALTGRSLRESETTDEAISAPAARAA